jgi:hypothetical protein
VAFFLWMFNAFTAMGSNGFEIALGESVLTLGVTLPLMYAASWKGPVAVIVLIFAVNMFWRIWIAPLRQHRGLATYDEKLSAQHNEIMLNATSGGTFLANAMKGRRAWPPLVVMLSWLLTTSYLMGGRDARTRWEHFVRRGPPDLVVLRIYGDTALAAPFDRKKWALGRETQFLKLESGVALRLENLGALRRP